MVFLRMGRIVKGGKQLTSLLALSPPQPAPPGEAVARVRVAVRRVKRRRSRVGVLMSAMGGLVVVGWLVMSSGMLL
jgi:hypothetical protein